MAKPRCVIIGAGGHAKVVVETVLLEAKYVLVGLTDLDLRKKQILGIPVLGTDDVLPALRKKGVRYFLLGVGGDADNRIRKSLFEKAIAVGLRPLSTVHPSAVIAKSASVGSGSVVLPRAVLNPDCVCGE